MRIYTCNIYGAPGDFLALCYVQADGQKQAATLAVRDAFEGREFAPGRTFRVDVSTPSAPRVVASFHVDAEAVKGVRCG